MKTMLQARGSLVRQVAGEYRESPEAWDLFEDMAAALLNNENPLPYLARMREQLESEYTAFCQRPIAMVDSCKGDE